MITNQTNQEALSQLIAEAQRQLSQYKFSSNVHQLQENTVFALGAQLMHIGQSLTAISGFKLEPGSEEYRKLLSDLVRLLEMPTLSYTKPVVVLEDRA